MPVRRPQRPPQLKTPPRMFETRSQSWEQAGLLQQVSPGTVRRARWHALLLIPLFVGVVVLYEHRYSLLGLNASGHGQLSWLRTPIDLITVAVLLILGWSIARDVGRGVGPALFRRIEPAAAGTVGFVVRLITVAVALIVALRIIGVQPRELALGGALTVVIVGLAAQQTLGNLFAGTVLLAARPFRVGDSVRLQGGMLAGKLEGTIASLGLLYTTFATEEGSIMVPNSVVLNAAVLARNRLGSDGS